MTGRAVVAGARCGRPGRMEAIHQTDDGDLAVAGPRSVSHCLLALRAGPTGPSPRALVAQTTCSGASPM